MRRQIDACNEAHDIDRNGARHAPLNAPKLSGVQIAADEHARRAQQGVRTRQKIEKQRIGAAKEHEWVLPQEPELHRQSLEIPTGVLR